MANNRVNMLMWTNGPFDKLKKNLKKASSSYLNHVEDHRNPIVVALWRVTSLAAHHPWLGAL
jgi:hypothetical protein